MTGLPDLTEALAQLQTVPAPYVPPIEPDPDPDLSLGGPELEGAATATATRTRRRRKRKRKEMPGDAEEQADVDGFGDDTSAEDDYQEAMAKRGIFL